MENSTMEKELKEEANAKQKSRLLSSLSTKVHNPASGTVKKGSAVSPTSEYYTQRRQTAPSDRDIVAVRDFSRRFEAFRSRAAAHFGGSSRQYSLPLGTRRSTGKSNGGTSMDDRVRSLVDAAKRWAGTRTTSVELAVAWASEDELDTDAGEDQIVLQGVSGTMGQADAQVAPSLGGSRTVSGGRGQGTRSPPPLGVEHWGDLLNTLAAQACRNVVGSASTTKTQSISSDPMPRPSVPGNLVESPLVGASIVSTVTDSCTTADASSTAQTTESQEPRYGDSADNVTLPPASRMVAARTEQSTSSDEDEAVTSQRSKRKRAKKVSVLRMKFYLRIKL